MLELNRKCERNDREKSKNREKNITILLYLINISNRKGYFLLENDVEGILMLYRKSIGFY